jgi:outer membrane protein OmpA-like peptidoglycan-associated protein
MFSPLLTMVLCGAIATAGCATKSYVNEQVTGTEAKLAQQVTAAEASFGNRADSQETKLRDVATSAGQNRRAIEATDQRLKGVDTRVGEVDAVATDARARAEQATAASRAAEARLAQRLAGRNSYRVVDTKAVYFDSARTDIRSEDLATLDEMAKILAADPNAILELRGFADTQGSDRYNRELARERIEVVMRYLVEHHDIELRQMYSIPMGKVALPAGKNGTSATMAEARRVDMRVLAPWSSWEDRAVDHQSPIEPPSASATAASASEAPSALPREVERSDAPPVASPGSAGPARLPALLQTITPRDLGGD